MAMKTKGKNLKTRTLPLIHVIGLPGSGKTTLGTALAKRLNLIRLQIGAFRARHPESLEGEAGAWLDFYRALSRRRWRNTIVETTGLNRRASFLEAAIPLGRLLTVKLTASKRVLFARVSKKPKTERGGQWLFSGAYPDKKSFVRKMYATMKKLPADLTIDTSKCTPRQTLNAVIELLKKYRFI